MKEVLVYLCPDCGRTPQAVVSDHSGEIRLVCSCGYHTIFYEHEEAAVHAWNVMILARWSKKRKKPISRPYFIGGKIT